MSASTPLPLRSPSLGDRFSAFLGRAHGAPHATPTKPKAEDSTTSSSSSRDDHPPTDAPDTRTATEMHTPERKRSQGDSAVSPPAVVGSSSSSGFFLGLKAKALQTLTQHRLESAERAAFKASGLEKINSRMMIMHTPTTDDEAKKQFQALDSYLSTYHAGRSLLVDVSNFLAAHDCPDELFRSSRLGLEFGAVGQLGPLDGAARISAAARRWWAAEEDADEAKNLVVLACAPPARSILAACVLFKGMEYAEIMQALQAVLLANENRLMVTLHLRSLPPSHKKFLSDFAIVHQYDRDFHTPKVFLHEMRIHRLPQLEEEGTRLLVIIIANRTQFLYTSQAQGGGHTWVPTTREDPLTVVIPLAVQFAGEASIKVWHLPEHASVGNPRQLILETKVHSAVLCLPCWRMPEVGYCQPTADDQPSAASSSSTPAHGPSVPPSVSSLPPPIPYPLHRLFLRRDELELNESDQTAEPGVILPEVEYHKNFRLSMTATPMEAVQYRTVPGTAAADPAHSTGSTAGPAPSSSSSFLPTALPAPDTAPTADPSLAAMTPEQEVDLHKLAAAWGQSTHVAEALPEIDAAAPTDQPSQTEITCTPSTPTKKPAPASGVSPAGPLPALVDSLALPPIDATPARRKRTAADATTAGPLDGSPSAAGASPLPAFVAPPLTVPPLARSIHGLRFYPEDKQGLERAETPIEVERRVQLAAEKVQLDAVYGAGNWRKQHGVLYTLGTAEPPPLQRMIEAQQAQIQAQHANAQAYRTVHRSHSAHGTGQAQAELARQHQAQLQAQAQAQQQQHLLASEAAVQAAASSERDAAAAQLVLDDPTATVEAKDEAMARMLAAQYAQEDAREEVARIEQHQQHRAAAAAAAALIPAAPPSASGVHRSSSSSSSSSRHRSSRSHRSRSSRTHADGSAPAPVSSPGPTVSVGADGSITLRSRDPSAAASAFAAAAAPGAAAPDDEALARAMQRQFDREERARGVASLAAAQGALNPDAMHYDQRLVLEELMGPASQSRQARQGASADEIGQLPEFRIDITSKYLETNCQICQEQFADADVLRQLQCLHAFHSQCVDPWLGMKGICPTCRIPVHHMH